VGYDAIMHDNIATDEMEQTPSNNELETANDNTATDEDKMLKYYIPQGVLVPWQSGTLLVICHLPLFGYPGGY
jgi:hypothetical protein